VPGAAFYIAELHDRLQVSGRRWNIRYVRGNIVPAASRGLKLLSLKPPFAGDAFGQETETGNKEHAVIRHFPARCEKLPLLGDQ